MMTRVTKLFTGFTRSADPMTYTEDEVEAAMCLWEEVTGRLERYPALADIDAKGRHSFAGGAAALRLHIMSLAKECDRDYNALPEDHPLRDEPFDWEFVPHWLAERFS